LALPDLRKPTLLREIGLRRRGAEQCTRLGLVEPLVEMVK
jgi:hypothetical protein